MPASRPRIESGIVWFQMTERNKALIMSAPPASASHAMATQTEPLSPAAAVAAPQSAAARTTARPWWWTRAVQPEVAVATNEPTVPAV